MVSPRSPKPKVAEVINDGNRSKAAGVGGGSRRSARTSSGSGKPRAVAPAEDVASASSTKQGHCKPDVDARERCVFGGGLFIAGTSMRRGMVRSGAIRHVRLVPLNLPVQEIPRVKAGRETGRKSRNPLHYSSDTCPRPGPGRLRPGLSTKVDCPAAPPTGIKYCRQV